MFIILYVITAGLALTGFQYLNISAVLFGICYLPGLTMLALMKKDSMEIEDLIMAFPCSIGISSLLTLGLLYIGVHVKFIPFIIYGISGFTLLLHAIKCRKSPPFTVKLSGGEIIFIIIAFLMTLLFSIPVISERIAISAHGFHHLSIVTRIFNGTFPPENPGLGGTAISYHWGYHALVAAISYPVDFPPLRVFSIINITSLFFILCIAYRSAKLFGFTEGYCCLVPLALVGLMRSDAGIFFIRNLITGNFPPVEDIASAPLNVLTSWVAGVSYLDTRLFFMSKFYNANNMPLGICLVFAFFLMILLLLDDKMNQVRRKIYTVLIALVLIALAITYAFFLIIPLLFVPAWAVIILLTHQGSSRDKFRGSGKIIVPCVIAAVITAPYLFVIASGKSVVTGGKSLSEVKFFYWDVQVIKNLIVFLLPSPFILAGFWVAYKQFAFSRKMLFLISGTVICLLLSIFLRLQWYNEEKFSFILLFFFSLLFVLALSHLFSLFSNQRLKKSVSVFVVVFLLATPVITEAAYICSPWFQDSAFAFVGRHVIFARDKSRNEAYTWIRENTPLNSVLVLPYVITPYWNRTAHFISYRPVALSERSLFVIKDVYAFILTEYEERVRIRELLFKDPEDPDVKRYLTSLNRPVYLLVEEGHKDPFLEGVEFDRVPDNSGRVFSPVFQNDRQKVYKIQYNN